MHHFFDGSVFAVVSDCRVDTGSPLIVPKWWLAVKQHERRINHVHDVEQAECNWQHIITLFVVDMPKLHG